jgi:RNA polymerase sigma-70 factor (ECF subfamily)
VSHYDAEFAEFVAASWDPCLRVVAASTGSIALAEDQTAEAFARAWASWHKVSHHPAPRAWVVRTALNAGASRWRRRKRETTLGGHDGAAAEPHGTGLDAVVLAALRRLSTRQREVIVLRDFLDLDIDTTARELGIAPGTVRAHLSRAMAALRSELAPGAAPAGARERSTPRPRSRPAARARSGPQPSSSPAMPTAPTR